MSSTGDLREGVHPDTFILQMRELQPREGGTYWVSAEEPDELAFSPPTQNFQASEDAALTQFLHDVILYIS